MSFQLRKINRYRRQGKSLIRSNKIKPKQWQVSEGEAKAALKAKGINIKQIKKIRSLQHQVCISFWDEQGNICSSFFSYRIFSYWQQEVERLIENCQTVKAWARLNYIMSYEFAAYNYRIEIEEALRRALENRLLVLNNTAKQAVFQNIDEV
jgi:hypothetical protein